MTPDRPVRLVLVHGSQVSQATWSRYPALLGPRVELVTPDLPSHGTRMGEPFTWESALDTISEAVGPPEPSRPVVLVGHSLGGYLAMDWAARNSGRLAGLALLGASAVPAGLGASAYRALSRVEQRLGPQRMSAGMDLQFSRLLTPPAAAAMRAAGYGFDGIPSAWAGVMANCGPHLMAGLDLPILFVNGQLDQMRVHVRRYRAAAVRAPWTQAIIVRHGLHIFPLTHPRETVAALWELLCRVDPGRT